MSGKRKRRGSRWRFVRRVGGILEAAAARGTYVPPPAELPPPPPPRAEPVEDAPPAEDVLVEALRITRGDRQAQYGPPEQDFARAAAMWTALKGVPFAPHEVAMFLIALKLSRETHQRKRDNWVDMAGYARCGELCRQAEARDG